MPERELSPYSARVALTQKLQQGQGSQSAPAEHKSRPWDTRGPPPERNENGHAQSPMPHRGRGRGGRLSPPSDRSRKMREESRSSPPSSVRDRSAEDRSQKTKSKDPPKQADSDAREREASPEPYRKPREASRERKRHRSRHRDGSKDGHSRRKRDHSRDRDRTKDRDRSGGRDMSMGRDRSINRFKEKRHERSGDHKRDVSRERMRTRDRDRKSERSRDRYRDRSRSRDGNRDRQKRRDRSKDQRSRSPRPGRATKHRSPSSSPPPKRRRKHAPSPSRSPSPHPRSSRPLPDQEISFRGSDNSALPPTKYGGAPPNLEKPNFKPTGLLAKAANKVEGTKISLKYHEPPEARKPPSSQAWRVIVFKGEDVVDTIELGVKSCWLLGREVKVVDYVLEHPSSSGQHAVIQFRYVTKTVEDEYGVKKTKGKVKPYVIDLESSNGTELNGERVETSRYFELRDKDILKFAGSEREYVVVLPPPEERKK